MKRDLILFLGQAREWGMKLIGAPPSVPREKVLEIYRETASGHVLVGRLWCEHQEYVFSYDSSYKGKPISAFPKMDHEYRSSHLWPFFAIRIPPLDRNDMRQEIANRSLSEDQIIEILGSVARVSVSNPYEFKLVEPVSNGAS